MKADLHCHTTLSDGSLGIEEIILQSKRMGLDYIAITDHDTLYAYSRSKVLGDRHGVNVIPAVELSAYDKARNKKVHILCYVPQKPNRLEGLCLKTTELRKNRGKLMAFKVMENYPITLESIMKYASRSQSIYKSHIKHALIDYGYATSFKDSFFDKIFNPVYGICKDEIKREFDDYPDVHFMIELIHAANGLAVMAHPKVYDSFDLLQELCENGKLDGVEVWHHSASKKDIKYLSELADKYNLITTGGSDFHGLYNDKPVNLGSFTTPAESLERIIQTIKKEVNI